MDKTVTYQLLQQYKRVSFLRDAFMPESDWTSTVKYPVAFCEVRFNSKSIDCLYWWMGSWIGFLSYFTIWF